MSTDLREALARAGLDPKTEESIINNQMVAEAVATFARSLHDKLKEALGKHTASGESSPLTEPVKTPKRRRNGVTPEQVREAVRKVAARGAVTQDLVGRELGYAWGTLRVKFNQNPALREAYFDAAEPTGKLKRKKRERKN